MKLVRRKLLIGLAATVAAPLVGVAHATKLETTYPDMLIKLVTGYPPGGAIDTFARILSVFLSERLGQSVIVDSRPGASGTIAATQVARSSADGYTLYLASAGDFTLAPSTMGDRLRYDPRKDFSPVFLVAHVPSVLVVHPDVPAKNVKELIALAKARPGELNYASFGVGSTSHIAAEAFNLMSGVKMQHVSYKGSGPAVTDLLAGRVQVMFDSATSATRFTQTGKLRALAVSTPKRVPLLPDVPTIAESGIPGYHIASWMGIVAPAGLPDSISQRLVVVLEAFIQDAAIRQKLEELGLVIDGSGPTDFKNFIDRETQRMATLIAAANIELQS